MAEALASAYANNPTLNAQRASLRATDEGVPQALSGYRPKVTGAADAGITAINGTTLYPRGVSLTIEQPIFLGHRTANGVKIAETAVLAGREVLRNAEQSTLLSAAQAFMNLVQAKAVLNITRDNLDFLSAQLRAANDRLNVGDLSVFQDQELFLTVSSAQRNSQCENVAAWPARFPCSSSKFQTVACAMRKRRPVLEMRMPE